MVLGTCEVKFGNDKLPVFFCGDTVEGSISFHLQKQKKVSDVTFHAKGFTTCRWSEREGTGDNRRSVTYTSHELHYRTVNFSLLTGHYPKGEDGYFILEPRLHTFKFSFILPNNLPSSFEGYYGRVRYVIKVSAWGFMKFFDNHSQIISVISKYDLNLIPSCMVPLTREINKSFNFFFSSRGAMQLVLSLPVTGFVPGQDFFMQCNIRNSSKVEITAVTFSLIQHTAFIATHPRHSVKHTWQKIIKYEGKGADKEEEISYPVLFAIPALPPSSIIQCLITTEYFVKVKAVVSGMHRNPNDMLPITIGTIPLHSSMQEHHDRSGGNALPLSPSAPPAYDQSPPTSGWAVGFDLPPSYDQLAPPTYEESQSSHMMTEHDADDKDNCTHFSPVYPVYNFTPIGFKQ